MNTARGDGRKVTRFTLACTLLISVVANVTHAVLADSDISLWLRVPGAFWWPFATFLAIEILLRTTWQPRASHRAARTMILAPATVAAITSYEHMRQLLLMMGEEEFIAFIGPLAVDLMMIGCTVTLLLRAPALIPAPEVVSAPEVAPLASAPEPVSIPAPAPETAPEPVSDPVLTPAPNWDVWEHYRGDGIAPDAPVSPAPVLTPTAERMRAATAALCSGQAVSEVAERFEVGVSTLRRYTRVLALLRNQPDLDIDHKAERVRPELVKLMRDHVREERSVRAGER